MLCEQLLVLVRDLLVLELAAELVPGFLALARVECQLQRRLLENGVLEVGLLLDLGVVERLLVLVEVAGVRLDPAGEPGILRPLILDVELAVKLPLLLAEVAQVLPVAEPVLLVPPLVPLVPLPLAVVQRRVRSGYAGGWLG